MSAITFKDAFKENIQLTRSANGLYPVTNELKQKETLDKAKRYPVTEKVLLFTSCFFGLNLAAARGTETTSDKRIEYLVCVDFSEKVELFWKGISPIISKGINAKEVKEKIQIYILTNKTDLFTPEDQKYAVSFVQLIEKEVKEKISWLSSKESFHHIQKIFSQGHFKFLRANLYNKKHTTYISNEIKKLGLKCDSIYISNIREYVEHLEQIPIFKDLIKVFREAIKAFQEVSSKDTYLFDTVPRKISEQKTKLATMRMRRGFWRAPMDQVLPYSPSE